ncbi:MAG TPA: hypothetical protein PKA63_08220 [Oligoflexia bacterium]|nr:hypothetical protein [Oligoflexia bacterium]HMP48636.1 hypothetical protein [Oligoflexia bacterium]
MEIDKIDFETFSINPGGKESLVIIIEDKYFSSECRNVFRDYFKSASELNKNGISESESLSNFSNIHILNNFPLDGPGLMGFVDRLYEILRDQGLRFSYLTGIGLGSCVVQQFAISHSRFARRVALFDPVSRVGVRSFLGSAIDFLESKIPCGLPLRKGGSDFDSRSEIHRLHSPSLVCVSPEAGSYVVQESNLLCERLPNVWRGSFSLTSLSDVSGVSNFFQTISSFLDVPAKAPQKNSFSRKQEIL